MIAVDTNILVYAHRSEMPLHHLANQWMNEICESNLPWGLPTPCISEFIRVTTQPRYFERPSELSEALGYIAAITSSPSCRLLRPGEDFLERFFHAVISGNARGKLVFDAQIVAICREHGIDRIFTNDRDFKRFEGIEVELLDSVHEPSAHYMLRVKVEDFLPS